MTEHAVLAAKTFGKVAVLMGGQSAERAISLNSGYAVLAALLEQEIDAHKVDVAQDVSVQLRDGDFDRAFIILHGRGGEDGEIQGVLTSLGIPFTGSGIAGSVLSMNKMVAKQIWLQQGLPTARFEQVTTGSDVAAIVERIGLPLFVKPVNEGSSIGMSKVDSADELEQAIRIASEFDSEIIVESGINGEEYNIALLDGVTLPIFQVKTSNDFYDFEAKYESNSTEYICPCGLSEQEEQYCQQIALAAFKSLRMTGWGRIDFMRDEAGQFYLLEANSIPGMTDHSLVPMAAKQSGLTFNDLVWKILETSMEGTE